MRRILTSMLVGGVLCFISNPAQARDVRLALLMAHQHGWKKDPPLKYALSGDLQPLARLLRGLGFELKVLQNPSADRVRKAMRWVRDRTNQSPQVKTFLFYYSGHADRNMLHLGPKGPSPLRYKEIVTFLRKLPVKRRVAILDACFSGEIIRAFGSSEVYKQLVHKGARRIRPLDLSKAFPNQGDQAGIQIISSSLNTSWESKQLRSSVFTHHLLRGLKGHADRDTDGKISVNELFNYVSESMHKEIRQKPLFFGIVRRTRSYALAPAYHSRLWIDGQILGKIKVSVANFYWSREKKTRRPVRLSVVNGKGIVELEHKGRCWQQKLFFPKGREIRLRTGRWKPIVCRHSQRFPKGSILLPAKQYTPPPKERTWSLSLEGGASQAMAPQNTIMAGGQLGFWHRYAGVFIGAWGEQVNFSNTSISQLYLTFNLAGGYTWHWRHFELFTGAYAGLGILNQGIPQQVQSGAVFQYGILANSVFWFARRWGISLALKGGFYLGRFGGQLENLFQWSAILGLRFSL